MPDNINSKFDDSGILANGRWRIIRIAAWIMVLVASIVFVIALPAQAVKLGTISDSLIVLLKALSIIIAYCVYYNLVRRGENRRVEELSLTQLPREIFAGLLIGVGMFLLVFASLRLLGQYSIATGHWTDWDRDIGTALKFALVEELVIRLVLFRLLARMLGMWWALGVSALLFGALHLMNPNASLTAALAIAVEAGLMLAAFYVLTGRIWMSIGVHAAWNFAQGPIFGARVSGMAESGSLFVSTPMPGSSTILSGGEFGPEASLSAMVVGLAIFVVVIRAARSKQHVLQASRRTTEFGGEV